MSVESTSQVGARAELIASTDLMSKGWYCYRNLALVGAADLIILRRANVVLKVQVKHGDGRDWKSALRQCDVLAVVDELGRVRYMATQPRVCRMLSPCQVVRPRRKSRRKKK
jgi:hypothetical protein